MESHLPFGLSPLYPSRTTFHTSTSSTSTSSRSYSPCSFRSAHSIQSINSILVQRRHRRRTSTSSIIPPTRTSIFGEAREEEDIAAMAVMEPRPLEPMDTYLGIGELLEGL